MRPRRPDIPPYVPIDSRLQLSKNKFLDNGSLEPLEEHTDLAYQANNGGALSSYRHVDVLPGPSGTLSKGLRSYRTTRSSTRLVEVSQDGGESLCVGGLGVGNGSAERLFQPVTVYDGGREAGLGGASDRAFPQSVYASGGNPDRIFPLASGASDRNFPSFHGSGAFQRNYGQSLHGGGSSGGSSDKAFSSVEWSSAGSISSAREQQPFIGQTFSPSQASVAATAGGVETVLPSQQAYKAGGIWPDFTLSTSGDGALISVDKEFSSGSFTESLLSIDLALRLVASAELMEEPFLISRRKDNCLVTGAVQCSTSATALRFWVNGSLGYSDKIQDGFYHIWGMNPHIWEICNDTKEGGRLPSLDMLRKVDPSTTSIEVVLFDKHTDPHLRELENRARTLANKVSSMNELAESLGKLVCSLMGGAAPFEDGELVSRWRASSNLLKDCFSCLVIPVGSLSVGLCRHRALLYKALADWVDLPCRIVRGCKYCGLADGASCLVLSGPEREWLVDLIAKPGDLGEADSLLKSLQATSISSPLRLPDLKVSVMASVQTRAEPELRMQVPGLTRFGSNDRRCVRDMLGHSNALDTARLRNLWSIIPPSEGECKSSSVKLSRPDHKLGHEKLSHEGRNFSFVSDAAIVAEKHDSALVIQERLTSSHEITLQSGASLIQTVIQAQNNLDKGEPSFQSKNKLMVQNSNEGESQQRKAKKPQSLDLALSLDGFEIPWEELVLRERIGAGSFGTVHRADWHGSDVAVKILIEQDFQEERLEEFVREVALMKRMRHPNVVLFMGAVTKRPNFSIVTEYLPRGSLFRLLHRAGVKEVLDEKRRIRMALDVARGMNYLHRLNPPIVHRDLKSPNLLVDKTWTVKVCDFGLSRFKGNTFLSSKSAAGTPEWMAPEVLRDEPSNEKSDIYSYGVILWELVTLQQPWNGLSPAQVVGAVGFQNRRLQIPKNVNPEVGALIEACFSDDPRQRPSFASIMESLKSITRLSAAPPS